MARRRRMHRETRRFLLTLSGLAVGLVVVFFGVKWLFAPGSTPLTADTNGRAPALKPVERPAASSAKPVAKDTKPAQKPDEPASRKPDAKTNGTTERKPDPAYKPPVPPTTQPSKAVHLAASESRKAFAAGMEAKLKNEFITARTQLNEALHGGLPAHELQKAREALAAIADETIFKPQVVIRNDPLVHKYTVKAGDTLGRIAKRNHLSEDFLAGINKLTNKKNVRLGSTMKIVDGPFNAAVIKKDHVMHIYLGDVYLKSFRVALGMNGGTPTGLWRVANHLENPGWTDPRTGHRWHPDDPANPIGEFWIGLDGLEGECVGQDGFGIHGTIEEKTIGQDVSLGCVRMPADDIAFVYKLLVPGASIVTIAE
jgi:LysM repeat protein